MSGLKSAFNRLREAAPKALRDCLSGIQANSTSSVRVARTLENGQQPEEPWKPVESADRQLTLLQHHSSKLSELGQEKLIDVVAEDDLEAQGETDIGFDQSSQDHMEDRAVAAENELVDAVPLAEDDLEMQGETGIGFDQGSRDHMEDRALVVKDIEPGVHLLAAIDGHGGEEAADFVKDNLALVVRQASPWPFHSRAKVEQRLRWLFSELDRLLLEALKAKGTSSSAGLTSGCVTCVVLQRGSQLFIGNLGDCKVICEPAEGSPYLLTGNPNMHHPDYPSEFSRLEKMGVRVSADKTIYGLAVSRTLGDFWGTTWTKPVGLSIEPFVTSVSLQGAVTLLVSTDGLETTEANACVTIRKKLRKGGSPEDAALALAKEMGCRQMSDNVGIIVVMFKRPEPLQTSTDRPNRFAARGSFKLDFAAADKEPEAASTAQAGADGGAGEKKTEL